MDEKKPPQRDGRKEINMLGELICFLMAVAIPAALLGKESIDSKIVGCTVSAVLYVLIRLLALISGNIQA